MGLNIPLVGEGAQHVGRVHTHAVWQAVAPRSQVPGLTFPCCFHLPTSRSRRTIDGRIVRLSLCTTRPGNSWPFLRNLGKRSGGGGCTALAFSQDWHPTSALTLHGAPACPILRAQTVALAAHPRLPERSPAVYREWPRVCRPCCTRRQSDDTAVEGRARTGSRVEATGRELTLEKTSTVRCDDSARTCGGRWCQLERFRDSKLCNSDSLSSSLKHVRDWRRDIDEGFTDTMRIVEELSPRHP